MLTNKNPNANKLSWAINYSPGFDATDDCCFRPGLPDPGRAVC